MNTATRHLLAVLAEMDVETLANAYGIRRADAVDEDGNEGCPLHAAFFAWLDAGCPDAIPDPGEVEIDLVRGGGAW